MQMNGRDFSAPLKTVYGRSIETLVRVRRLNNDIQIMLQ